MSESLLSKVVKEHERLLMSGKEPNSLFLNALTRETLATQAAGALGVQKVSALVELLGMTIFVSDQYRDNQFRIYCKFHDLGEF